MRARRAAAQGDVVDIEDEDDDDRKITDAAPQGNDDGLALELGSDFSLFASKQAPFNRFSEEAVRASPLKYWQCMSLESKKFGIVAQIVISLKAGSCSVERVNSHQKHIMASKRASLDFKRVNRDMNIRMNLKTLRKLRGTSSGSRAGKRSKQD